MNNSKKYYTLWNLCHPKFIVSNQKEGLCWSQIPHCWKSHAVAHLNYSSWNGWLVLQKKTKALPHTGTFLKMTAPYCNKYDVTSHVFPNPEYGPAYEILVLIAYEQKSHLNAKQGCRYNAWSDRSSTSMQCVREKRRVWWDCAYAQTRLCIRYSQR